VHQQNSLYQRIYVYREGSVVSLRFGRRTRVVQSKVDLENPHRHVHEYTTLCFAGLLYNPEPERMLVLGLGGGVIPREMRHYFPDLHIDVAEIDPAIPPIAKKYFGFRTDEDLNVHVSDGRMFIRQQLRQEDTQKYDYIVLDAYAGDFIPFHLTTREFMQQVREILADDGVVVANVIYNNKWADSELKTFQTVFERCQVFLGDRSTNAILVAPGPELEPLSRREAVLRASELQLEHEFSFDLRDVARRLTPAVTPGPGARVLTDDRAPVNWLRAQRWEKPATVQDKVELLDGRTFDGELIEVTDEHVRFMVVRGTSRAQMKWPPSEVHAVVDDGERRVITPRPAAEE
jgi:spermidine synthase